MTQTPDGVGPDGPAPDDSDVGAELRHAVERAGAPDRGGERGSRDPDDHRSGDDVSDEELDLPAFTRDDGGMDVPPPG